MWLGIFLSGHADWTAYAQLRSKALGLRHVPALLYDGRHN